jgi:diguanylate cyclase (GGDEF)-like protein
MPHLSRKEAVLVKGCLAGLRSTVRHLVERPFRDQAPEGPLPQEISSMYERCAHLEMEIARRLEAPGAVSIDDEDGPLLKLAVHRSCYYLSSILERPKYLAFHHEVLDNLEAQLSPYKKLMARRWFQAHRIYPMPRLYDFLPAGGAVNRGLGAETFAERQLDEKFQILLAPSLLHRDLEYYRRQCELTGRPIALAYVDIDNFKATFNAPYGETLVDRDVLPRFMLCLAGFAFGRGHAYRYGGDEYAILLPGISRARAEATLDDLRTEVRSLRYPGIPARTTISIGLFIIAPDCTLSTFEVERASEQAKNVAKKAGRNQIAVCSLNGCGASFYMADAGASDARCAPV